MKAGRALRLALGVMIGALSLLAASVAVSAAAATGSPATVSASASEREALAQRRQAIEAEFARAQYECRRRFAVNACVDAASRARREGLAPVREAELRHDEAERQDRAALRRALIAEKQRAVAERPPGAPLPDVERPAVVVPVEAGAAPPAILHMPAAGQTDPRRASQRERNAPAAAAAQLRAQAAELRRQRAREAQQRVRLRLEERARDPKAPPPLPVPAPVPTPVPTPALATR